jgi:hypothetical protein
MIRIVWIALLAAACATRPEPAKSAWIQAAIDDWETICKRNLHVSPEPLPWMILIDDSVAWHVAPNEAWLPKGSRRAVSLRMAGKPVRVFAVAHDDQGLVRLPNGTTLPVMPYAAAMLSADDREPFFVAALPDIFRRDPAAARDPLLDIRLLSVVSHEIIHTRQLPAVSRQLQKLRGIATLPEGLDDNVIQKTFGSDPDFRAMFLAERDLLYQAVRAPDDRTARTLTREATDAILRRRARFFHDELRAYAEVEDVFLSMEGIAEWSRFKLEQEAHRVPGNGDEDILAFLQGKDNDWSQDEGLALFLLIDRLVPDWQAQMFGDRLPSPVDMLRRAVQ